MFNSLAGFRVFHSDDGLKLETNLPYDLVVDTFVLLCFVGRGGGGNLASGNV